jgi:hypothetical protein
MAPPIQHSTCLYCNKKLRQKYHTTWKHTDKKPHACGGIINDGTWESKRCGGKEFKRIASGNWQCQKCYRWETTGRKQVETRVPAYDKPGDYGDGFFCNKKHGYRFALRVAAQLEKRMKSVESALCRCVGPHFNPDKCPIPGHGKIARTPLKLAEKP